MSQPAPPADAPPPRPALLLLCAGWLALLAGTAWRPPFAVTLVALLAAVAGGTWITWRTRRWQSALALVALLYWFGRPAVESHASPPPGTGTLVTLVAFAVLVAGGAWVRRRSGDA